MEDTNKFMLAKLIRTITYNMLLVYEQIQSDCNLGSISNRERKMMLDVINKICEPLEVEVVDYAKLVAYLKDKIEMLETEVSTLRKENIRIKSLKGRD